MKTVFNLLLIFLTATCFGEEIDTQQKEKSFLVAEKIVVERKLLEISETPVKFAQDRIKQLDTVIPTLPIRKASEGRITMREYLQQLRNEVYKNPAGYTAKEIQRLVSEKDRLNAEIQVVTKELRVEEEDEKTIDIRK
jgi:hypothetical protein